MRLRRTKSLVFVLTASLLVAVGSFVLLDLWWRYDRAIGSAESRATTLSRGVSEYVRGTFALADTSLRQLAIHGQRVGGAEASAADWMPILEAAQAGFPGSGSLSVTDAQGVIRHSTLAKIVGQSRRDDYLFKYFATHRRLDMMVDEPLLSPILNQYVMPVGRRLETPDGEFDGMVVCVVTPGLFREFFRTMEIGKRGIIWVFHPNGILLFREPSEGNPLGEQVPRHPLVLAAKERKEGLLVGRMQDSGPEYISAYRSLDTPHLVIGVSLDRDEILADWRMQRRATALGFGILTIILGGMLMLVSGQIDARSKVELAFADAQRQEAERLRDANDQLARALDREKEARDGAEAANRLKDEFLMTLSHELRTPLNAVLGWVGILARGAVPDAERPRVLATIQRNAQAQTRLIEDLLDVSRAISGKLQLRPRPVLLPPIVAAAVDTLRPAIDAKSLAFTLDVDPHVPGIVADPDRLQQVVWNLLSNAIKFTAAGGAVGIEVRATQREITIEVRDTGAGIPPAFLPFVFDRFRQADSGTRRESGGLGLGLAISRQLVELHGGTLTAASEGEGRGATFRIALPLRGVQDARFDDETAVGSGSC